MIDLGQFSKKNCFSKEGMQLFLCFFRFSNTWLECMNVQRGKYISKYKHTNEIFRNWSMVFHMWLVYQNSSNSNLFLLISHLLGIYLVWDNSMLLFHIVMIIVYKSSTYLFAVLELKDRSLNLLRNSSSYLDELKNNNKD